MWVTHTQKKKATGVQQVHQILPAQSLLNPAHTIQTAKHMPEANKFSLSGSRWVTNCASKQASTLASQKGSMPASWSAWICAPHHGSQQRRGAGFVIFRHGRCGMWNSDLCGFVEVLAASMNVSDHEPDILQVRDTVQHLGQDLACLQVPVAQETEKQNKLIFFKKTCTNTQVRIWHTHGWQ